MKRVTKWELSYWIRQSRWGVPNPLWHIVSFRLQPMLAVLSNIIPLVNAISGRQLSCSYAIEKVFWHKASCAHDSNANTEREPCQPPSNTIVARMLATHGLIWLSGVEYSIHFWLSKATRGPRGRITSTGPALPFEPTTVPLDAGQALIVAEAQRRHP